MDLHMSIPLRLRNRSDPGPSSVPVVVDVVHNVDMVHHGGVVVVHVMDDHMPHWVVVAAG